MSEENWKKHLLKSGLPFEYEVKERFVSHGCTVWDEYSYIRTDENQIPKEFSFDQQANTWINGQSVDFMIECKYKLEPTKWIFLPDPYAYQHELSRNGFLNCLDHFLEKKFILNTSPYDKVQDALGPFCLKGVELIKNDAYEMNVTKPLNQLAYAFVDHFLNSIDNQLSTGRFADVTYLHIPVVITNADLFLIKEGITTEQIKSAENIEDVSTKHDFLLYHSKPGTALENYNYERLYTYFNRPGMIEKFKGRNKSFTDDVSHYINVVAKSYCPSSILIMHHEPAGSNYQKLMDYINYLLIPSKELQTKIKNISKELEKLANYRPKKKKSDPKE